MSLATIRLKKHEDRRIRLGHPWIFSNEINNQITPLKNFSAGQEVIVENSEKKAIGIAYINPHSLIAGRLFSTDITERLTEQFFLHKIKQALGFRERLFDKPYYRLVYAEGDGLPGLIIDRFNQDFVMQINTAGMELQQENIIKALVTIFPNLNSIYLRNESAVRLQEGLKQYCQSGYGTPPSEILLIENDIPFLINFTEGQKTGWFFDQRHNRARLKDYVKGQRVLDVFSYVGAFGINAGSYGAKQVICIESSKSSLLQLQKNIAHNHLDNIVSIIEADAFLAMKEFVTNGNQFDVIILDPPAFVKKQKDLREGLIAYERINALALKLLSPGGILMSCSCSMLVNVSDFTSAILRAAKQTRAQLRLIDRGFQGPDHPIHMLIPETDYLKVMVMRKG